MNAVLESLTGLLFLDPWLLGIAIVVPIVLLWRRRRGEGAIWFAPAPFADGAPRSLRVRMVPSLRVLQILGLLSLVVALARPVQRDRLPIETEGVDILLCLDVSSSMAADDMAADDMAADDMAADDMAADDMDEARTRLDVAKDAATRFIAGRGDDRIGLVSFARFPDLRCPLTLDHEALTELLDALAVVDADSPEDATGIGAAVARASQMLADGTPSRVVILLTDGEENVATAGAVGEIPPAHAAQLCARLGVRVHTISVGASEVGGVGDYEQVRALSEQTGGRFFRARDAKSVAAIYTEIDALERATLAEPRYRVRERYAAFLSLGVLLLLAGRLLETTVLAVQP